MLDEQPIGSFATAPTMFHPDQDPAAMQPMAIKYKLEVSAGEGVLGAAAAVRLPKPTIP